MIKRYENKLLHGNASEVLISFFTHNLIVGLSTIYVASRFTLSLQTIKFPRTSLASFMNSVLVTYLIPKLIGLFVVASGIHFIVNGIRCARFYYKYVKMFNKKNVKITMNDDAQYPNKHIEGTLFILEKRLVIVSKEDSYTFIHEHNLNEIESIYVGDIRVQGAIECFEHIMMCLKNRQFA